MNPQHLWEQSGGEPDPNESGNAIQIPDYRLKTWDGLSSVEVCAF